MITIGTEVQRSCFYPCCRYMHAKLNPTYYAWSRLIFNHQRKDEKEGTNEYIEHARLSDSHETAFNCVPEHITTRIIRQNEILLDRCIPAWQWFHISGAAVGSFVPFPRPIAQGPPCLQPLCSGVRRAISFTPHRPPSGRVQYTSQHTWLIIVISSVNKVNEVLRNLRFVQETVMWMCRTMRLWSCVL